MKNLSIFLLLFFASCSQDKPKNEDSLTPEEQKEFLKKLDLNLTEKTETEKYVTHFLDSLMLNEPDKYEVLRETIINDFLENKDDAPSDWGDVGSSDSPR